MANAITHDMFISAYDQYADAIFRHCYFRVFDRERGRELMQDVFMKTWEYVSSGKKVDNLRALLYKVANNLIIDEARRKNRRSVDSLEDMQEEGFDLADEEAMTAADKVDARNILHTIAKIEEPYRSAVIMRYIDELSPKEIAIATGEPANVISVRINRGMQKLRSHLGEDE